MLVIGIIFFLPESPCWLVKKDRSGEVCRVLAAIHAHPHDSDLIAQDVAVIQNSNIAEHVGTSSSPLPLTKNRHLHRTILAVYINLLTQMTGANIATFTQTSSLNRF